ncbi:23S rRNA (adenine(2030)-N(6))-methyltransferase RlmJ [Parvibaculum sedimenti]|uniref:Ribosomal RNA large subunit methyltransferase J n=1 Tax=Parvibaculum sedimenti TaxID=2608632 RepID=A0A6N6VN19_9HYPH|nr:23S rRNA (adenine(2030)-N(6))-methyltransferase RlmJ [Parvibaculum sedimenti]KAB7741158.1 23S rRNA (adenine(2030)-N(6))-methyltransferase RlmJ [Parvibaculum sedimenti]
MNYRHAYHAGNFADVMKHSALALVIEHMKQKDKPFFLLDTHAGTGLTDLTGEEAQKTGEFRDGIARIMTEPAPHPALAPYLAALTRLGCIGAEPMSYPGSPLIARELAREGDRLAFCELHPEDAASLKSLFRHDPQTSVHEMNGYTALKAMLPPKERRGLVLIDPPFEARDEFDALLEGLEDATARWATGTYIIWYPVKDPSVSGTFLDALERGGPAKTLMAEIYIRAVDPARMSGCGLVIVNPPWTLKETLTDLYGWLAERLEQGAGARARVEWLKP